jgi:crotonobetainyl-CoA:carnitine CoA-transferase CaiB-like acyl-CoA transferase
MSALDGLCVVDFGHFAAGPYVSRLLSDLGADVVKIEPIGGDRTRSASANDFAACNAGKRSVVIDLKTQRGLELAQSACRWADVVHHNFRLGVASRFGLDAATLRTARPELIVLEINAYGTDDERPGFDGVFQGVSGLSCAFGGEGNAPDCMRFAPIDYATASLGAISVLAALIRKRRTGEGASLSLSLLEGSLFLTSEVIRRDGAYEGSAKVNASRTGCHPAECLYEARDGWLAMVVLTDEMATGMARVLGIDAAMAAPVETWDDGMHDVIAGAVAMRTVAELVTALRAAGVWVEPCDPQARQAIFGDPFMADIGAVHISSDGTRGRLERIGLGVQLETTRPVAGLVPLSGEHTVQYLAELGIPNGEIQSLVDIGIVEVSP